MTKKKPTQVEHENNNSVFDYDRSVRLVYYKDWFLIGICAFIILVGLLWSFFGSINVQVSGMGIIIPGNQHLYTANTSSNGTLEKIIPHTGDYVTKGERIAVINQVEQKRHITSLKTYLVQLKKELTSVQNKLSTQEQLSDKYYKELFNSLTQNKQNSEQYRVFLHKLLNDKETLYKGGMITVTSLEQTQVNLYQALQDINQNTVNALQGRFESSLEQFKRYQEFVTLKLQYIQKSVELEQLQLNYSTNRYVTSPIDGNVISINTSVGDYLQPGAQVLVIAEKNKQNHVVALFSPLEGKKIKSDMKAYVTPSYVNKFQYGSVIASVKKVSPYPSSNSAVIARLADPQLISLINQKNQPMIIVDLIMKQNPKSHHYQWTSASGYPHLITNGSICDVDVTTQSRRPITYVIPFFRRWLNRENYV